MAQIRQADAIAHEICNALKIHAMIGAELLAEAGIGGLRAAKPKAGDLVAG